MSLINEALKKAQHLRTHSAGDAASLPGETGPIARRGPPRSARSIVLMVCGGVVLVVLTAVGTVFFFNRPASKPVPVVAFAATAHKPGETDKSPAPVVVVPPAISVPIKVPEPAATTTKKDTPAAREVTDPRKTAAVEPAKSPASPEPASATPPVPATPQGNDVPNAALADMPATGAPPSATATGSAPAKPDERVQAWVDAVKIAGIRPSGADSKVFMKDRLFRINDIVDRTLGIRLLKVETNSVTFSDANGATYVKSF